MQVNAASGRAYLSNVCVAEGARGLVCSKPAIAPLRLHAFDCLFSGCAQRSASHSVQSLCLRKRNVKQCNDMQGIARGLVNEATAVAHNCGVLHMYVHVEEVNVAATRLYESCGFCIEAAESVDSARKRQHNRRLLLGAPVPSS